jgi:hypothetical protein
MSDESLRKAVSSMDSALAALRLQGGAGSAVEGVTQGWTAVVGLLALPLAAPLRDCPQCHRPGFLAATRCGFCWVALTPPALAS